MLVLVTAIITEALESLLSYLPTMMRGLKMSLDQGIHFMTSFICPCVCSYIWHSGNDLIIEVEATLVFARDCQGARRERGSRHGCKRATLGIFVVMEMFYSLTVLIPMSWL